MVRIDREAALATLTRPDGGQIIGPWQIDAFEESSAITAVTFEFGGASVRFETRHGDHVEAELPRAGNMAPIDGRPVVYLDQNHWSTLAQRRYEPERVRSSEHAAADRLIELARQRRIILPVSAGHMSETCQWSDDHARYRLALTMLQLSAGWQMRDPLSLRRFELQRSMMVHSGLPVPDAVEAITLEPGALYADRVEPPSFEDTFPPEIALACTALTETATMFDVMLDAQPIRPLSVPGWGERLTALTGWIDGESRDPGQRRQRTRAIFLEDLSPEIASAAVLAGITRDDVLQWAAECDEGVIEHLPSLGVFRELLHEKLLNPGTVWEENDLVDMIYLSCGAAYAEFVVAERSLSAHLRNSLGRLRRRVNVYRKLADLLPEINGVLGTDG